jgi:septum formation protein
MDLILASTSPYRRALLERLGIPFRAMRPGIDESGYKAYETIPRTLAEVLATAKAVAVGSDFPDAIVIGSDQVATLDDLILDKPGTPQRAAEQLAALSGREHRLITAMAVSYLGDLTLHTDVTTLAMRRLTPGEIARYVEVDHPLDCAGSYKIESRGITLFEKIVSEDHTAIVGLPLISLTTILRSLGVAIP